jgi:deoxycytidine triphosphate deaminase
MHTILKTGGNMQVLSRDELIALFNAEVLRIEHSGLTEWANRDYSEKNPFQQCSIDLSVGHIYVPETDPEKLGGALNPKIDEHVLEAGHTVMIRTKDKITMPANIGGICFSPSRLALKAILITNMGHVDPGYSGHLHFTAINMGREAFTFRDGDIICSMIFFRLANEVQPFGPERFDPFITATRTLPIPHVIAQFFPKLAKDFVDVQKRAEAVADKKIKEIKLWQWLVPIITGVVLAFGTFIHLWINKPLEIEVSKIKEQIMAIEKKSNFEERLIRLEKNIPVKKDAVLK